MHVPYESSGDTRKVLNDEINRKKPGIIIENRTGENNSETNANITSWPENFVEILLDDTTETLNRKCLKVTNLQSSIKIKNIEAFNVFSISKYYH